MGLRRALIAFFLLTFFAVSAQDLGLRRPSTKLFQINTDTARIIYAQGQKATAQRVSNIIHYMASHYPIKNAKKPRKISILLQNATDIPNGYVGLGPWRSEFYLSPPQNSFRLGSQRWADILAIHEYRHVQQISAARTGFTKLLSILLGEQAYTGALHLALPNWYIEGDAVIAETAFSSQGRGRLPFFLNGYRQKLLEGQPWNYEKARNLSLKEFIPNHYRLGFLLQNYGREKYGQNFWDEVMQDASAYKEIFYPFSRAMKNKIGKSSAEFYQDAMNFYSAEWQKTTTAQTRTQSLKNIGEENSDKKQQRYRKFSQPFFSEDGTLLALVESFDHLPAIYALSNGKWQRIITPGFVLEPIMSYRSGKYCWAELRLHPRWEREDYSVIMLHDTRSGVRKQLTSHSSYFAPSLAPDGERLVAIHDNDQQHFSLHILKIADGTVLQTLDVPAQTYPATPVWSTDGEYVIFAMRHPDGKMSLAKQDIHAGRIEQLAEPSFAVIGRPYVHGDGWIYFSKTHGNLDEIFRVNIKTKEIHQLTDGGRSKYGPVIDPNNSELIFSQADLDGDKLRSVSLQPLGIPVSRSGSEVFKPFIGKGEKDILAQLPEKQWPTKKYGQLSRPINFHSWNIELDDPVYGIRALSENVLSSISVEAGFQFNRNDDSYGPTAELTLSTWYPEILVGYSGRRRTGTRDDVELKWFQNTLNAGLRLPLRGIHGAYSWSSSITSRINHINTNGDLDFSFDFLSHSIAFTNRRRRARQHPLTRFGQRVRFNLSHAVDTTSANQFAFKSDFTFPSPLKNHVFLVQVDYRKEMESNTLRFSDVFEYPRGYNPVISDEIFRVAANYQFPLLYPDLGFAGIVYLRRLRCNLFADYTRARSGAVSADFNSVGIEAILDLNIFNIQPVSIGIRWSHLLNQDLAEPMLVNKFGFFIPLSRI